MTQNNTLARRLSPSPFQWKRTEFIEHNGGYAVRIVGEAHVHPETRLQRLWDRLRRASQPGSTTAPQLWRPLTTDESAELPAPKTIDESRAVLVTLWVDLARSEIPGWWKDFGPTLIEAYKGAEADPQVVLGGDDIAALSDGWDDSAGWSKSF